MNMNNSIEKPYILLTPGPLTTSKTVKEAMLKDWCTWDKEYNILVQDMRAKILKIAEASNDLYTVIPMQGSGTFSVEAVLTSTIGDNEKVLILSNGAYGDRMEKICTTAKVNHKFYKVSQTETPNLEIIEKILQEDKTITHLATVHCETTSGILNPIKEIGELAKKYEKIYIVDAMSSFGGIHLNVLENQIDFLISSANKCIQGVPGFGFVIAKISELEKIEGKARSHSLDIFDQWKVMELGNGKWRFTSPTHVVRAFYQALLEFEEEGGVFSREKRYRENQKKLVKGMMNLGFKAIVPVEKQSPIITTFYAPSDESYNFETFYKKLKEKGFVIYPGKLTEEESFRIGNIGEVYPSDIETLIEKISEVMFWK
ncbi:MAG: 2-aminoethylphosphonate--pyruvate transaminase [Fusobacteriaceae bacterium]